MEFFLIGQDRRYKNPPVLYDFVQRFYPNLFCPEECRRIPDKNVVYAQSERPLDFLDVISGPVCLVSETVKRVLQAYDDTIVFKMFFIFNTLADEGAPYYAPVLPKLDCIRQEGRGREASLAIDCKKTGRSYVCRDGGDAFRNRLIVNLDVAESLLRRDLKGIAYQRLEGKRWRNI